MKKLNKCENLPNLLRNTFLSSVFLLLCLATFAQSYNYEYIPVVEEGKTWFCFHQIAGQPSCIYMLEQDTLIGERNYVKVLCQDEYVYADTLYHYYCAVREESKQVFVVELDQSDEKLLYDFSCPSESILLSYGDVSFERPRGELLYYAGPYIYYLHKPGSYVIGYGQPWVDGVGAVVNPFLYGFKLWESIACYSCKTKEGTLLFDVEWLECEPVDAVPDVHTIGTDTKAIYDLQGRRLSGKPQRGVYIQEGRKHVVK